MGMIGGVPRKAMYFVGYQDSNLIYLDPHLVQTAVSRSNLYKNMDSFHCEDFRTINRHKLDSSVAFTFYLKNLSDLNNLVTKI